MAEWSKAPHSKCGVRETVPWVQIPLSPLYSQTQYYILFLMKPFHFAIIGVAFLLLAVVAYVVYEYAEAPQSSSPSEVANIEVPVVPERTLPTIEVEGTTKSLTYSEMVDVYVKDIASASAGGKYAVATTTLDFGYATVDKTMYTDTKGAVVRYVKEGGSDHRYVKQDYYYRDGALLFAFVVSGGNMGDMISSAEYKIYFGKDGGRVLEVYLPSGSSEYAQPKTWTEVVLDPKTDFLKGTAD